MKEKDMEKTFKALANRRRLEILKYLREKKEASVTSISNHIKLSFKSTSRHIAVLYGAELVIGEHRQKNTYYSLSKALPNLTKTIISNL